MARKRYAKNNGFSPMGQMKENLGVGIGSMAGMGAVGSIASMPGMPAAGISMIPTIGAGMNLLNVGTMAKSGMGLVKMVGSMPKMKRARKRVRGGSTVNSALNKMLYR